MIAFMRDTRTPVRIVAIPAPCGVLAVTITDEEPDLCEAAGVFEVHQEIPDGLCHPGVCWVRGCAENAHAPTGVVDSGEDVLACAGQRDGLDEIHRQDHLGLGVQDLGLCHGRSVWRRVDPGSFGDLPHG
jgi:hypothetical protein